MNEADLWLEIDKLERRWRPVPLKNPEIWLELSHLAEKAREMRRQYLISLRTQTRREAE